MSSPAQRKRHVVELEDGVFAALSEEALLLYDGYRRKVSPEEIARQLSARRGVEVKQSEIETAQNHLREQVAAYTSTSGRRGAMRLFEVPLIPSRVVYAVARQLTWLFNPAVAITIVLATIVSIALSFRHGIGVHGSGLRFNLALAALLFLVSVIVHEFGHAAASSKFGVRPREIGLTMVFVFPAFYSDVTPIWAIDRWKRLVVDLGGAYLQCIPLAIIAACTALTGERFLYQAELFILGSMALNLNPILRLDGYWALADALDIRNLAAEPMRAVRALAQGKLSATMINWRTATILSYGALNLVAWIYFSYITIMIVFASAPMRLWAEIERILKGSVGPVDFLAVLATLSSIAFCLAFLFRRLLGVRRLLKSSSTPKIPSHY